MTPVVKKSEYFLKNNQRLALVGALSFDIATRQFKFEPMVMGYSID